MGDYPAAALPLHGLGLSGAREEHSRGWAPERIGVREGYFMVDILYAPWLALRQTWWPAWLLMSTSAERGREGDPQYGLRRTLVDAAVGN